jgi:hypothetical protein
MKFAIRANVNPSALIGLNPVQAAKPYEGK